MGVGSQSNTAAALIQGNSAGIHCTGGCVGPRAGVDRSDEEKI